MIQYCCLCCLQYCSILYMILFQILLNIVIVLIVQNCTKLLDIVHEIVMVRFKLQRRIIECRPPGARPGWPEHGVRLGDSESESQYSEQHPAAAPRPRRPPAPIAGRGEAASESLNHATSQQERLILASTGLLTQPEPGLPFTVN